MVPASFLRPSASSAATPTSLCAEKPPWRQASMRARSYVLTKVHAATLRALNLPDVKERIQRGGAEPVGSSATEAATFLRAEIKRWGKVIRTANVKAG